MTQRRLAGLSLTMLMSLFLAMSMGTSVLGSQPSQRARGDIPARLLPIYQAAAASCPGLPWAVLAAIGKVESDHGRSTAAGVTSGVSAAGTAGPMRLGVAGEAADRFVEYAVDADGGGADVYNPADAIFTVANYLCRHGARGGADLRRALLAYRHADRWVDKVGRVATGYETLAPPPAAGPRPARDGRFVGPDSPSYQRLTPTTRRLYAKVATTFGIRSIGGWRAVGSVEGSDHPHGRAIDVMLPYPSAEGRALGWRIAGWAVARADTLDVKYVIFHGRIWTRSRGWHGYRHPADPCNCNPTLRHDDHVHISTRH
jgi:hypothetical protein